jgi:hypothetical protein
MNLKKIGKLFTSKFVGTGRGLRLVKKIYRAAVPQILRNTGLRVILLFDDFYKVKVKVKIYPRTGHECPEGGRGITLLFP